MNESDNSQSKSELTLEYTWISLKKETPETLIPILACCYNKQMNITALNVVMYEGKFRSTHRWSICVLLQNKRSWYVMNDTWEVTHWTDIYIPEQIEQINKTKKVINI